MYNWCRMKAIQFLLSPIEWRAVLLAAAKHGTKTGPFARAATLRAAGIPAAKPAARRAKPSTRRAAE